MVDVLSTQTILGCIWFMLPAGYANMAPLLGKRLFPSLAIPLDGGKTFGGQPLFGEHKTYRGLILAVLTGLAIFMIQQYLYRFAFFHNISLFDYTTMSWFMGVLLGLGAICGDLVKSFFKRRVRVNSGKTWFPFDQIDFSVGAILFAAPLFWPGLERAIEIIIIFLALHIIMNVLAFAVRLKDTPW